MKTAATPGQKKATERLVEYEVMSCRDYELGT